MLTDAVLEEIERAPDPRFRAIMTAAVRHLHAFVREARLSEIEFHRACAYVAKLGQMTTASHNEVVLCAGSLGISSLVCLLNNGEGGNTETTANLMGPFWRLDSPRTRNGESIVRSATPGEPIGEPTGEPIFVDAWVRDTRGRPVAGAEVDVWHASNEGFYESQDPGQADMNLRGKLTTDDAGHIAFRSIKPRGYPIPVNGPVGDLLRAQGRHNLRPAHIHFMIYKAGYKTQFSQVYSSDDPFLESDVQFGVTRALTGHYVLHDAAYEPAPDPSLRGAWYSLQHSFTVEEGIAALPPPPVTGKATGDRPSLVILDAVSPS
jgi:catechol 1,2-dioxygenase